MHEWLDSWAGLGLVVVGMAQPGWDLELTAYAGRDRMSTDRLALGRRGTRRAKCLVAGPEPPSGALRRRLLLPP